MMQVIKEQMLNGLKLVERIVLLEEFVQLLYKEVLYNV